MSSTHSKNEETLAVILEEINKKLDEEIKIRKAMPGLSWIHLNLL